VDVAEGVKGEMLSQFIQRAVLREPMFQTKYEIMKRLIERHNTNLSGSDKKLLTNIDMEDDQSQ
jgi:hypothetical protein